MSEKRVRTDLVCVRLTPSERATLASAAAVDGISVSGFLRVCGLALADQHDREHYADRMSR